jgi:hypothetical protein
VLLLAEVERRLGIAERVAGCIVDPRDPAAIRHSFAEMIRFRALLIACGYPDPPTLNDGAACPSQSLRPPTLTPQSPARLSQQRNSHALPGVAIRRSQISPVNEAD